MARHRSTRWDLFHLGPIAEQTVGAQFLYSRLPNISDHRGVTRGNPQWIKSQVWPLSNHIRPADIRGWLSKLRTASIVFSWSEGGEDWLLDPCYALNTTRDSKETWTYPVNIPNELKLTLTSFNKSLGIGIGIGHGIGASEINEGWDGTGPDAESAEKIQAALKAAGKSMP